MKKQQLKKLPIGISTFSEIRGEDYLYIDKSKMALDLIENSIAIVTISGTAAWEGFGKLKPALMFGFHPNVLFKGAYRVKTKNDCKIAIENHFAFPSNRMANIIKLVDSEPTIAIVK